MIASQAINSVSAVKRIRPADLFEAGDVEGLWNFANEVAEKFLDVRQNSSNDSTIVKATHGRGSAPKFKEVKQVIWSWPQGRS